MLGRSKAEKHYLGRIRLRNVFKSNIFWGGAGLRYIFQEGSGWETFAGGQKWRMDGGTADLIHTTFGCLQSLLFALVSNYSEKHIFTPSLIEDFSPLIKVRITHFS